MHNKRIGVSSMLTMLTLLLGGCSSINSLYASIYDTLRFRQQQDTLPGERTSLHAPMTYQQYDAEREQLLRKEKNP